MTEQRLQAALQPYAAMEYLPQDMILPVLRIAFPSFYPIVSFLQGTGPAVNEHLLGMTTVRDVLGAPLVNWRLNRPPDQTRCAALAQYLQRSGQPIDSVLVLALNHRTRQFDILDGIHRYHALRMMEEPILDAPLIVNIRTNFSEGKLVEVFQNINKSVSVPELYLRDTTKDRRECVERLATQWQMRYPSHFKATKAPQRPNTNRDLFIAFLDHAYDKMELAYETEGRLAVRMEEMNAEVRLGAIASKALPDKMVQSCEASGCYLFTMRLGELEGMI